MMNIFKTHITYSTANFFKENEKLLRDYLKINRLIKNVCGINDFFSSQAEATDTFEAIQEPLNIVCEPERREYGDYQTNEDLAVRVTKHIFLKYNDFEFVLEPTCGRGNFILACIQQYDSLKKIVGVEIYLPYVWETKFKLLSFFIENPKTHKPEIDIIHGNAFDFPYEALAKATTHLKTLVIGNPPWVTSSELGSINSRNLPKKSNFKKHDGFDAITGKGNFDIGEYISLIMLRCFQKHNGIFSFLIKNSVIKNLIHDQVKNEYRIGEPEKLIIDAKREFDASVNAALFVARFDTEPGLTCKEYDFYSKEYITTFGWYKDKFVNSIDDYLQSNSVDGKSKFIWRSGIKHDCSKIMELEISNGQIINGLGEEVNIEENLVYGLLKSSDLKDRETNTFRKQTIVTQTKIGQKTDYIRDRFPLTYKYLNSHRPYFNKRKSSIYKDKPDFSIFGVGDYSFASYKVAISGLYKSTHFTLVLPHDLKPLMLDDTCYFIGFAELEIAQIAHYLVNSPLVQNFLKSIIFSDSKRSVNKDVLMRIDFEKVFELSSFEEARKQIVGLKLDNWEKFSQLVKAHLSEQIVMF